MADLTLHRDHTLGLARARKVARQWAEDAERKLEMACTLAEGDEEDVLEFTRPGVDGRMAVTATFFHVEATLGFLFKPFAAQIEAEVARKLDEALAREAAGEPAGK